ncbi:MAG: MerR family DNA-binding protein [Nitrococcus sp.]|nr:MerR family DNA-binding protein [Nitrococcus sp.]
MKTIRIGELAELSGIGKETIRFYERQSLLPRPRRTASNYRRYPPEAVRRLQFIRRAKALGFTLDEIRELLSLQDANGDRAQVKRLTERKLSQIRARIVELSRMEDALSRMHAQCSGEGAVQGCPIIETLAGHLPDTSPHAATTEE